MKKHSHSDRPPSIHSDRQLDRTHSRTTSQDLKAPPKAHSKLAPTNKALSVNTSSESEELRGRERKPLLTPLATDRKSQNSSGPRTGDSSSTSLSGHSVRWSDTEQIHTSPLEA